MLSTQTFWKCKITAIFLVYYLRKAVISCWCSTSRCVGCSSTTSVFVIPFSFLRYEKCTHKSLFRFALASRNWFIYFRNTGHSLFSRCFTCMQHCFLIKTHLRLFIFWNIFWFYREKRETVWTSSFLGLNGFVLGTWLWGTGSLLLIVS